MNRIFKLAFLDVKMMMKSIVFIGGFGAAVLLLVVFMIRNPLSFNTDSYMYQFFEVMKYVFILNGVLILGRDYIHGTYKYLYTGAMTRYQVLLEKLMALTMFSIVCGILQTAVRVVVSITLNKGIDLMDLFSMNIVYEMWLYIIFSLLTGCFSMMLLGITKQVKVTFITAITLFGVIQFYSSVFILLIMKEEVIGFWLKTIFYTPTFIIWNWMHQSVPTIVENSSMLIYILLMALVTIFVISKKDMNIEQ